MAKAAAKGKAGEAGGDAGTKGSKRLLFMIVGAVLLLAAGGGGAWFFLQGKAGDDPAQEVRAKPRVSPVFEKLDPFVVNLADRGRYLQVVMELRVADAKVQADVKKLLPEIRNGILLVLSGKRADDISSVEGKQRLQMEIRQAANRPLGIDLELPPMAASFPEGTEPSVIEQARVEADKLAEAAKASLEKADGIGVIDVLFTSFVIQ